jgi:hypothetical protein
MTYRPEKERLARIIRLFNIIPLNAGRLQYQPEHRHRDHDDGKIEHGVRNRSCAHSACGTKHL